MCHAAYTPLPIEASRWTVAGSRMWVGEGTCAGRHWLLALPRPSTLQPPTPCLPYTLAGFPFLQPHLSKASLRSVMAFSFSILACTHPT
jgi:hypothetical protein